VRCRYGNKLRHDSQTVSQHFAATLVSAKKRPWGGILSGMRRTFHTNIRIFGREGENA
jgi:hypothetical protein